MYTMEQELLGKWQVHEVFTKGSYLFSTVLEVIVNTASGRIMCASYKLLTYSTEERYERTFLAKSFFAHERAACLLRSVFSFRVRLGEQRRIPPRKPEQASAVQRLRGCSAFIDDA